MCCGITGQTRLNIVAVGNPVLRISALLGVVGMTRRDGIAKVALVTFVINVNVDQDAVDAFHVLTEAVA